MFNKFIKRKKGFTLIELIVVIAILGILAAVLVPSIGNYVERANKGNCLKEARSFLAAAQRILVQIENEHAGDFITIMADEGYGTVAITKTGDKYVTFTGTTINQALWTSSNGYATTYSGATNVWTVPSK